MVSIKVFDFNENQLDILKKLYQKHLIKDNKWHFFWEGDYTLIRCQEVMASKVMRFLRFYKVRSKNEGEWIDNINITLKYQNQFQDIFHGFSIIAMKCTDEEIDMLLDRMVHCFLNNVTTVERRDGDYIFWEPMKIITNAVQRAVFIGQMIERSKHGSVRERIKEGKGE